jgi:photosystem II stability/assembly factor-like uncharacterized protein
MKRKNQAVLTVLLGAFLVLLVGVLIWLSKRVKSRNSVATQIVKEKDHRPAFDRHSANHDAATSAVGKLVFSDVITAWQLDYKGELLMTRDGGKSWTAIGGDVTKTFDAFTIVDGSRGLASDNEGGIWKTDDGGFSWYATTKLNYPSPKENQYQGASQVLLSTGGNGFVVDTFAVWKTSDNGVSWNQVKDLTFPQQPGRVREMILNSQMGWAICDGGAIFHTEDGSTHWQSANGNLSFDIGTTLETIYFVDDSHGWLSVTDAPRPYPERAIFFTEDGGKTWRLQKEISNRTSIYQVFIVDKQTGWMAGGEHPSDDTSEETGILFETHDGGRTWSKVRTIPRKDPIRSVRFFSRSEGWLATDYDIYRTHDGGTTWLSVLSYPKLGRDNSKD